MTRTRTPSPATRAALFLLAEQTEGLHGYDITRLAGVSAGTLYPMLARLEAQGLLTAEWCPAIEPGRPPRHVYRLTARGVAFTHSLREAARVADGVVGRRPRALRPQS
jgi:PadR family transcriptional regulator, regulatory protein PadR